MPFVSNMPDEEEQKTNQPNGGQGPISPTGGGGGAVHLAPSSAVAPGGGGSASGSGPAAAGGSFASLDKYLSANQGQAAPLTSKITSSIGDQYSGLDAANNAAISSLNTQVANAPGYTASNPNVLEKEAADPVSFASDQGNVNNFQNLLNNTYGGITQAESTPEYTAQQGAINNAIAAGTQNTTTEAGRKNLLTQNEATPTTGVTALNSAILSQDPNSLNAVESAYKPFNNLMTNLNTGAAGVDTTIGKEQADAATSSAAANKAIADQNAALTSAVTSQTQAAKDAGTTQNAQILSDVKNQNLTPQDLTTLGVSPDQWSSLMAQVNLLQAPRTVFADDRQQAGATTAAAPQDLTQYLTQVDPNTAFTNANTATKDQYALAGALQTLKGTGLDTIINNGTVAQAGTAPVNLNSLDAATATTVTTAVQQAQLAGAQAFANALQSDNDVAHAQQLARIAVNNKLEAAKIGAGVGTVAGGIIGSIIPGGGTMAGAAIGSVAGAALGQGAYTTYQDASNLFADKQSTGARASDAANLYADIASYGMYPAAKAIISAVSCFAADTPIEMADGSTRPIQSLRVGDQTRGGRVELTLIGESTNLYDYKGIVVVGAHVVKESAWKEVRHSADAIKLLLEEPIPVYCMCTSSHSIWINGTEFHDAVSFAWFYLNFMKHDQHEAKLMLQRLAEKRND